MIDLAHHRHRPGHQLRAILFDETGTILAKQSAESAAFPSDGCGARSRRHLADHRRGDDSNIAEARSYGSIPTAIGITNQ